MTTERFLNDCWSLHFHDPDDNDWTDKSYKLLGTLSTVRDWQAADVAFTELWQKGMFFVMREHIKPMWEDDNNKDGGCLSFKINKPDAAPFWFQLGALMLGETAVKNPEHANKLCGISISPKRNYCILRVWVSSNIIGSIDHFNITVPEYTQVIYKSHKDNNDFSNKK
jgi:hypothetical protein